MVLVPSLLFDDGGGAVPRSVALAPSQDIRPASVVAVWSGSGASGTFLACLSIYSASDVLISRTAPPVNFAPGDTGVVTYAPFLGSESEAPPPGTGVFPYWKDTFDSVSGDNWADIWSVPFGGGTPVQLTANGSGVFDTDPLLSPDGTRIIYLRTPVVGARQLRIMDADGSNDAAVAATTPVSAPMWRADSAMILYRSGNAIKQIAPDGSGNMTILTVANAFSPCYNADGSKVAYVVNPVNPTADTLRIVNADGTGDALLDTLNATGRAGFANPFLHGSDVIIYVTGSATGQMFKINADGTGKTDITAGNIVPVPSRFSVAPDDSVVYTPRAITPWALWQVPVSGAGESAVSPALALTQVVGAGQAYIANNRVYTVRRTTLELVSIALDGSGLRVEDTVLNGPTVFETISVESNNAL